MTSENSKNLLPIPQVPKHLYGLLGNLPDVDPSFFMRSVWNLAALYGDIFELDLLNRKAIVVSSYALAKEVLDDDRFEKLVSGGLTELRPLIKDGLFTAYPDEINWHKAHRILMPVFGPLAVRKMFDGQMDIASQLILKWDRMGPNHAISCSDDFTRLAFDTIGLCAYSYRFNNFYADNMHPFATQMADALTEAGKRSSRTKLETSLRYFSYKEFQQNVTAMHQLCDEIVDDRVKNPQPDNKDLLGVMLNVADPETGEKLDTETVRYNMVTFLIAGHETTSGTLSFLFYYLLKNPDTYHKAQREVDEVVGNDSLTVNHLSQLKYIDACIKETLRFQGPIGAVTRHAKHEGEVIGGKYAVDTKTGIVCNLMGIHRDPAVWGDDAGEFKPERMLDFKNIPAGAWKPFGTGIRACIGRAFAEQEMLINVALILQRFQVEMADPSYTLELKSTLTMKPADFSIKVRRRPNKSVMVGLQASGQDTPKASNGAYREDSKAKDSNEKEILILYGSNAGTCRAYADDLAENAGQFGFSAKVKVLDTAIEDLPTKSPVVIITPSYEGKPADNAKKFVSWLEVNASQQQKFQGVQYALFGVGNSEWASTFHKVPKRVDELMSSMGATTVYQTGFVDVKTDTVGPWEEWCEGFWPKVTGNAASVAPTAGLQVKIEKADQASSFGEAEPSLGIVKENFKLADSTVGSAKMHMEIKLPENMTYRTGDYMVIHPYNHRDDVRRVLSRFKLRAGDTVEISDTNKAFLITKGPVTVFVLLASKVELSTPVTQRQLEKLSSLSTDSAEKASIKAMASDKTFATEVLAKRFSILDILEDFPSCNLGFAEYLDLLKPLTPRQYSISSFPMVSNDMETNAVAASITYDVHECPAWSGKNRVFHGVSSSYLADCKPGNQILCSVRPTNAAFHLPPKTETPIILIAAGTGIAPMRGFIQERAAILEAGGKTLGPALLYFGCRDFEEDYIYKNELQHWEALGAISVRPCFSKRAPSDDAHHYQYTFHRLYAERDEVADLFEKGAKIFVCGSASKIAKSTAETCIKIWLERNPDKSQKDAEEWLDQQRETRYVSDVFG